MWTLMHSSVLQSAACAPCQCLVFLLFLLFHVSAGYWPPEAYSTQVVRVVRYYVSLSMRLYKPVRLFTVISPHRTHVFQRHSLHESDDMFKVIGSKVRVSQASDDHRNPMNPITSELLKGLEHKLPQILNTLEWTTNSLSIEGHGSKGQGQRNICWRRHNDQRFVHPRQSKSHFLKHFLLGGLGLFT